MSKIIETIDINNELEEYSYESNPDHCPFCHYAIEPIILEAFLDAQHEELAYTHISNVIYKCPRNKCHGIFIGKYHFYNNKFSFFDSYPKYPMEREFGEEIKKISRDFVCIYNQAYKAEQYDLKLVAGPGYRKSLEFLIKDYAIGKVEEDTKAEIPEKFLGEIINKFIDDKRIQSMAKRAVWLGNDETHFFRKWEDRDIDELKDLIELTVKWIEMVELSERYETEMPDK